MRRSLIVAVLTAAIAALGGVALAGSTVTVKVADNYFIRRGGTPTLSISAGTTVVWKWRGASPHNVVVSSGPVSFRSPSITTGSFPKTLSRRGTYRILCTIHPNMRMTIKVS